MKIQDLLEYRTLDLTALPENTMTTLKKTVRKLANAEDHEWVNALELVHTAYEQNSVTRPSPSMKAAWKQYEQIIAVAVKELSDAKGALGSWRITDPATDFEEKRR